MANLSRALVSLSDNLGMLANNSANREHEKVMAMRQENFMRLQHMLGEESRTADRAARKEEFTAEVGARKEMFGEETRVRREEAEADRALRQQEGAADRALRRSEGAADRGLQAERWDREDLRTYDQNYLTRTQQIDKRIQELSDYSTQAQAEGKLVDNSFLAQQEQELGQLREQKRALAQERDVMLARGGDSRYRKLSAEEVARIKKEGAGPMPNQTPGADPAPPRDRQGDIPMAAQAPAKGGSSIKLPPPPPGPQKPAGMIEREGRKRPPERQAASGPNELAVGEWDNPSPTKPRDMAALAGGKAGQGMRDLVSAGRAIVGDISNDMSNIGPLVKDVKATLAAGKRPSAEQIQQLSSVKSYRLKQSFTADQLKALGL